MSNKQQYIQWVAQHMVPLFHQPAWLDVVSPSWDVAISGNEDQITGALPYCIASKKLGQEIYMPMLTPYLGPVLAYPADQKYSSKLSFEKKTLQALIQQLPELGAAHIKCLPSFENGLPFFWNDYQLSTRYTYIVNDASDTDSVFSNFKDSVRREIRKAEKQLNILVDNSIDTLFALKAATYEHKGQKTPISKSYVQAIYKLVADKKWGTVYSATDDAGQVHASVLFVWDDTSCYYLLGAADPQFSTSGAMSMLMWHGIQLAAEKGLAFNFEGSMIPEIERFFSAFGGQLSPYLELTKTNSNLLKLKKLIK